MPSTVRDLFARCRIAGAALSRGLALAALVAVAGPGLADPAGGGPVFRIVAFGSSSTEGVGASRPALSYPAQVEHLLNDGSRGPRVSVINRGVGGEDIDDMLARLDGDILSRKPDLVIWQVGSNDPIRNVPPGRFEEKLRAGLRAFRAARVEVVLMEPQWCPKIAAADANNAFLRLVRTVGEEEKVAVIRRYDLMQGWLSRGLVTRASLVGPDGLHMTDRGYSLLAEAVSREISTASVAYRARSQVAASPHAADRT